MEESGTVENNLNMKSVRYWVTREATLQAAYNWYVAMKHRKGLVRLPKEKEEEDKGSKILYIYIRRKKDERGKRTPTITFEGKRKEKEWRRESISKEQMERKRMSRRQWHGGKRNGYKRICITQSW